MRKTTGWEGCVVHEIVFSKGRGERDMLKLSQFQLEQVKGWSNLLCTLRMVQGTDQEATKIAVRLRK